MIVVREKSLKNKISLYLDIYVNGERKYEFLKIYILKSPKTAEEKAQNKINIRKAEIIRIKRENEIIDNNFNFSKGGNSILFLDYFKELVSQRRKSEGNHANWDSCYKILKMYYGTKIIKLVEVDDVELNRIKDYILNKYKTKAEKKLSQNAAHSYFNKVKACLNQAFDEKLITDKVGSRVKAIKPEETHRNFLIEEEIELIKKAECDLPILKNAFLFSVYSGLRWSDIVSIKWSDLQYSEAMGNVINFVQKKTKGAETLPIPEIAMKFIKERGEPNDKVFKGLKYSAWNNVKLTKWMIRAGITKDITFHSARHSYATLLLSKDVDIYTVSKLLGHKDLKTTQIYTKVIDKKKTDAVNLLNNLFS